MHRTVQLAIVILLVVQSASSAPLTPSRGSELIRDLQSSDSGRRARARELLIAEDDPSIAAALVELVFFSREARRDAQAVLESLLRAAPAPSENPYQFWLEEVGRREDLVPLEGYVAFKARLYSRIDPAFGDFLDESHPRRIRPEEIVFGGVRKDGIPALDRPAMVGADEAGWMRDEEIIFGLFLGGEAKAYPRRILDWHEMANDRVGGESVTLAWCTLCGSAIAYRGRVGERSFTFGTSGLLYRSNKLMYDRQTGTLWSQLSGRPVMGPLASSDLQLEKLPIIVTTWKDWRTIHPDTLVVSRKTGFDRDYDRAPYAGYFASDELMFPVWRHDARLDRKEWVWTAEIEGVARAWKISDLQKNPILNDHLGDRPVLLLTNPKSGGVRMYERPEDERFVAVDEGSVVAESGARFRISEEALTSEEGARLIRLTGHEAFWFAWADAQPSTSVWSPE